MNRITITGRLTRDPELRSLPSGDTVCNLRLAVDGMGRGGRSEAGYIDVASFGDSGAAAAKVLAKGWLVAVDGHLRYITWSADDGENRHDYQIVGNVEFLAAPKGNAASGETRSDTKPTAEVEKVAS
jgi:single-strand DNA-binding protein